jgi:O-antigen ligase
MVGRQIHVRGLRPAMLPALLVALAFAPLITSLASWSLAPRLSNFQYQIRSHSYPTLVLEVCMVLFALMHGLNIAVMLENLPRWQKWMLALVAGSAVLSVLLVAPEPALAWQATIEWCIHFLFAASIIHIARVQGSLVGPWFWNVLVAGSLCYVGLVAVFVHAVPDPETFPWHLRMPGFTHLRHIGYFIAPAIGAILASCLMAGRKLATVISLMALWVLVCFICWTGSRGSVFALVVSVPVSLFLYPALRCLRLWLILCVVVISAVLASDTLPQPASSFGLVSRLSPSSDTELTSGRFEVWKATANAIVDEPLIGHGAGQFRVIIAGRFSQPLNHPHNLFLQILFQWGVLGAIGFFSLLGSLWLAAWRASRGRGIEGAPAFMVLNTLLAFSLLDGTGNYPFPIVLMLVAVADLLKVDNT